MPKQLRLIRIVEMLGSMHHDTSQDQRAKVLEPQGRICLVIRSEIVIVALDQSDRLDLGFGSLPVDRRQERFQRRPALVNSHPTRHSNHAHFGQERRLDCRKRAQQNLISNAVSHQHVLSAHLLRPQLALDERNCGFENGRIQPSRRNKRHHFIPASGGCVVKLVVPIP